MSTNNDDEQLLKEILSELKTGSVIIKRKRNGEKYPRRFVLDADESFLFAQRIDSDANQTRRYQIERIDEIRIGYQTLTFDELAQEKILSSNEESMAFSILYNNYRDELHMMANDEQTRDRWVRGLRHLIAMNSQKRQRYLANDKKWIISYLSLVDKDKSKTFNRSECRLFINDLLNVDLDERTFEEFFTSADKNGKNELNDEEFVTFFRQVTHRDDLYQLMIKHVQNAADRFDRETIFMTPEELLRFLRDEQKQMIVKKDSSDGNVQVEPVRTVDQVKEIIEEFEPNEEFREKSRLSLDGFRHLLLSDEFSLMKPSCSKYVYQDMTRPLNDYFINTSHNTYLFDNQIVGDSNPEAYNRALRAGCRSVEIDCHDGPDGRPIVKHGFTFVKACLFESIIRLIEPNLFLASPYPVILDLENHCSIEQQREMALVLKKILGDRLISLPISDDYETKLPSPEQLKHRVLLRGLKVPFPQTISRLLEREDLTDDESVANPQSKVVEGRLGDLFVYLQNVPYAERRDACEHDLTNKPYFSSSLSERQFNRVVTANPLNILEQTSKCMLRMYPDGLRQDSSNPNPIYPWNFGVQLVAVNHQKKDDSMSIYYGKFRDNGGCGYVIKPKYLIESGENIYNPFDLISCMKLDTLHYVTITIISAQFLSRSVHDRCDIPDPYVVVSTHGLASDCHSQRTRFIQDNGLNPTWNETFQFTIRFPHMSIIRFDVFDYDVFSRDDRLAYFSLPLLTMQTGYRHIHLKTTDHRSTYSTLFVHISIETKL